MKENGKSAVLIAGMILFWSVFYAVSKYMVQATGSPYLTGGLLRAAALIFLTAQLLVRHKFRDLFRQGKTVWIMFVIGCIGFLGDFFANLGYANGSLGVGTALMKTDVLMANLVTVVLYKRRLTLVEWLGTIIMLVGVLLVLNVSFGTESFRWSDVFFLLSAVSLASNAFVIQHAQRKYGKDPDMISYINNLTVLVLFTIVCLITGDYSRTMSTVSDYGWIILLGGFAQTGIYFFYYRNLQRHEVWIVKLYLLLMPVVSCLIGVVFLHETMTLKTIAGIVIVLLGAGLLLIRSRLPGNTHNQE